MARNNPEVWLDRTRGKVTSKVDNKKSAKLTARSLRSLHAVRPETPPYPPYAIDPDISRRDLPQYCEQQLLVLKITLHEEDSVHHSSPRPPYQLRLRHQHQIHIIRDGACTVRVCVDSKSCGPIASCLMWRTHIRGRLEACSCHRSREYAVDAVKLNDNGRSLNPEIQVIRWETGLLSFCL